MNIIYSKNMNIIYSKKIIFDRLERNVFLLINNEIKGELVIEGIYGSNNECFDSGNTCSLSIYISEEYQKRGYSKFLWKKMLNQINNEYNIRDDQMFFIDADASNGYWEYIGMKENRYGYNYKGKRYLEGKGYEKVITFKELCDFFRPF
jgi:hypothetical protein